MKSGLTKLLKEDQHYFGIANLLTLSRLLILPFIAYFLTKGTQRADLIAFFLCVLSGMTDFFDGYFARKLNQNTHLGKILDPVIDKINVGTIMLYLAAYKGLPYWYVLSVIGRDVMIMLASVRMLSKIQIISASNIIGKVTLTSFLIVIIFSILSIDPLRKIFMYISTILIPISLLKYSFSYRGLMGKNKFLQLYKKKIFH